MSFRVIARVALLAVLLAASLPARSVEHPGTLPQSAECSSCHQRKVSGKSVHTAISSSCTVCHVAQTRGDMTTLTLLMPKEQICFACHEKSASLRQHVPAVKKSCLDCHDAHSSNRRMLLLDGSMTSLSALKQK